MTKDRYQSIRVNHGTIHIQDSKTNDFVCFFDPRLPGIDSIVQSVLKSLNGLSVNSDHSIEYAIQQLSDGIRLYVADQNLAAQIVVTTKIPVQVSRENGITTIIPCFRL